MSVLRVATTGPAAEAPPVYPLPARATLGQFKTVDFRPHLWIGSDLARLAVQDPRVGSAWLSLWCHAFVSQAPGGTLPIDDAQLAHLAGLGGDVAGWGAIRGAVLAGWAQARVLDDDGAEAGLRLAHPDVTAEAERLWKAHGKLEVKRERNAEAQARARVRKQLTALGAKPGAFTDARVEAIRVWLDARGLDATRRAVAQASVEVLGREPDTGFGVR